MYFDTYTNQVLQWPQSGRHIIAQFDAATIIVYQAYRPAIADYAIAHQQFGGEFSYSRMSWIKPNFLWMMFRSGWATKAGQERILAVRLQREFFDSLLANAVPSQFDTTRFQSRDAWQAQMADADIRLQWDPDHDPEGRPVERRAIQLGLRGETLRRYGKEQLVSIEDLTPFVQEQRSQVTAANLLVPTESVYIPSDHAAANVGLDHWDL
jgi:hypothetical protein